MPDGIPFAPDHRGALERYAAAGCRVSRYMLDHDTWFPEAIEALHRERCGVPAPIPNDNDYPEEPNEWR